MSKSSEPLNQPTPLPVFRLCFVGRGVLYFTSAAGIGASPLQWGNGWSKSFDEASEPYPSRDGSYLLLTVGYMPGSLSVIDGYNAPSVESINRNRQALLEPGWGSDRNALPDPLCAGATLQEAADVLKRAGGALLSPVRVEPADRQPAYFAPLEAFLEQRHGWVVDDADTNAPLLVERHAGVVYATRQEALQAFIGEQEAAVVDAQSAIEYARAKVQWAQRKLNGEG